MPGLLLHRIPEGMDYGIAALAEPMAIVVHQVTERCGISCQDFVVVTGAGPVGIMAAFVAKACGAGKVILSGLGACEQVRFPAALALGADMTVNVETQDLGAIVMDMTDGNGADVVLETSGSPAAIGQSMELLKKCGRLCAIGMPGNRDIPVPWQKAVLKSLDIICCMSSSYSSWDRALSLMQATVKDLGRLITHREKIDNWEWLFRELEAERGIKGLFLPQE
jgi:L-iditol 2-dehydrogenase